jgi:hypothetical protein
VYHLTVETDGFRYKLCYFATQVNRLYAANGVFQMFILFFNRHTTKLLVFVHDKVFLVHFMTACRGKQRYSSFHS